MKTEDCYHSEPDLMYEELKNFTAHPAVDECCFGDTLFFDETEEEAKERIDNYVHALRYYKELELDGIDKIDFDVQEANIIVDVFMLHHNAESSKRSESLLIEGVKHVHDAFRNRNQFYRPHGVDTKINFSVGNIYYINGQEVWGDTFVTSGIRMGGTGGATASEAFAHCKQVAGTTGDPTRYAVLAPHRIQSTQGNVAGFAYMGQLATRNLSGNVTRDIYVGGGWLSKTLIHEFAHSFGVFHTFQSSTDCGVESTAGNGDRVEDTPTEVRTVGAPCFNINKENHESYGAQSGRWVFTIGQMERMIAAIFALYSSALTNPRVLWYDEDDEQPPVPPTPPSMKVEFSNIGYEVLDAEAKTIRFTMDVKNALSLYMEGLGETPADDGVITVPINYDDEREGTLLILNAENKWKCPVSGIEITGFQEVEDVDGKGIFMPVHSNNGPTINGLVHGDYTYRIKCKFTEKIGNVQSIISKRIHHNNNESFFYLFTWTNNQIFWDNTSNSGEQRRNTGYNPKLNELLQIHATRDLGMWVKAGSSKSFLVNGGSPNKQVVNTAPLRLGFDHTTGGRGMGGVIYEVEIYDRSYGISEFS